MKPTPHIPIAEGLVYEALGEAGGIEEFLHRTARPAPAAGPHGVAATPGAARHQGMPERRHA